MDDYLHEQDILLDWDHYRPDMNSIEHIWDAIGYGLEEWDPQSVNLRQLGVVVQNVWQQIPLERVQTLVCSMQRRFRALVDARGSSTRYRTANTLGLTLHRDDMFDSNKNQCSRIDYMLNICYSNLCTN